MEIFKQLKKLGYKHYIDLTIEELDALPIDNIEKRIEYSLVIDWFREKHNLFVQVVINQIDDPNLYLYYYYIVDINTKLIVGLLSDYIYSYEKAREQAILKAIELIKHENVIC